MSKEYYCATCGTILKCYPKALRNKQIIVKVVEPHECDDDNIDNIKDSEIRLDRAPDAIDKSMVGFPTNRQLADFRPSDHIRKASAAPLGIIGAINPTRSSEPIRPFEDFDDAESEGD